LCRWRAPPASGARAAAAAATAAAAIAACLLYAAALCAPPDPHPPSSSPSPSRHPPQAPDRTRRPASARYERYLQLTRTRGACGPAACTDCIAKPPRRPRLRQPSLRPLQVLGFGPSTRQAALHASNLRCRLVWQWAPPVAPGNNWPPRFNVAGILSAMGMHGPASYARLVAVTMVERRGRAGAAGGLRRTVAVVCGGGRLRPVAPLSMACLPGLGALDNLVARLGPPGLGRPRLPRVRAPCLALPSPPRPARPINHDPCWLDDVFGLSGV
jgi:hypothetical protein